MFRKKKFPDRQSRSTKALREERDLKSRPRNDKNGQEMGSGEVRKLRTSKSRRILYSIFSETENPWGIGIQKIIQSKSHFKDTALVEIEEKVLIGNGEWREAVIFVRKLLQEIKQWDGGMDSKWMDSSYILQVEWTFKGGWPCRIRRWS